MNRVFSKCCMVEYPWLEMPLDTVSNNSFFGISLVPLVLVSRNTFVLESILSIVWDPFEVVLSAGLYTGGQTHNRSFVANLK